MSYTPGPWAVEEDGEWLWISGPSVGMAVTKHVFQDDDARLIAAAPDLLEAAQLMREWGGCFCLIDANGLTAGSQHDDDCTWPADLATFNAAIAKATGTEVSV